MRHRFVVGSRAFFSQYSDFVPNDEDVLIIDDSPTEYKVMRQTRLKKGKCVFEWRRMSADEWIEYTLNNSKTPMETGKFLVKEVAEFLGLTIDHLKLLEPIVNIMDDKHAYEKAIYESYIENGSFTLTEEQMLKAYEEYKKSRENETGK